jgi:hypothetical protein
LGIVIAQWITDGKQVSIDAEIGETGTEDREWNSPVSSAIQSVKRLRHVQDHNVELEESVGDHEVVHRHILSSRHQPTSVKRYDKLANHVGSIASLMERGRGVPLMYRCPHSL